MKFSIRDLLLVTVIVALAVGSSLTWLDRQRLENERQRLAKENDQLKARDREIEDTLLRVIRSMPRVKPRNILEELPTVDDLPNSSEPAPNPPKP